MIPEQQAEHDYYNVFLKQRRRLRVFLSPLSERQWRVLDLGCGFHYPNVILFHGQVAEVWGTDVVVSFFREGRLARFRSIAATRGLLRGIKWATIEYSKCQQYYRHLEKVSGIRIDHSQYCLCRYDAQKLPFEDGYFDAVVSNAVLEHVRDLPVLVRETHRLLRQGGIVDMRWHNFYCPSGGHRPEVSVRRSPWGHITGEAPMTEWLNRVTPEDVRSLFISLFQDVNITGMDRRHRLMGENGYEPEGTAMLTPEWQEKLAGFSADLLTTRAYLVQGRK